ncbi:MAG: hypothetical protein MJ133_07720 [Lachnospiraceae bacterium]|nr:hypothetical protein [Lachnospiraceae bacterium]
MASIEYGIDGYGRKVSAQNASPYSTYKCFFCKEDIHVRKGRVRAPYFAHNPISNRTPQQMACEGYTSNGTPNGSINSNEDRICIFNGGVPLHLIERSNNKYEIVALFPPLSSSTMKQIEDVDGKIRVIDDGRDQIFSAWNFRKYRLKTSARWIYVKPDNFKTFNEEIRRKWFLGFRGLDFDNDLFKVDNSGGVRVGQLANIVVGNEYLFVHNRGTIKNKNGLHFERKGTFEFPGKTFSIEYDVYSVKVTQITDESIAYIQSKGYQLINESDELVPLWPPAVIEGKELIYHDNDREAYMYHKKEANQEVFWWGNAIPYKLNENENILKCSTINTSLLMSDYSFNIYAKEIRYLLTHNRDNFTRNRVFEYNAVVRLDDGRNVDFDDNLLNESFENPILLNSNYKSQIISFRDNYVKKSASKRIDELPKDNMLMLSFEPFGNKVIVPKVTDNIEKKDSKKRIDYEDYVFKIYHCHGKLIETDESVDKWLDITKSEIPELYKYLMKWKINGKMPLRAVEILKDLESLL